MPTINVKIEDKFATADESIYVCDNSDFVIDFNFDEEWNQFDEKTARFRYGNKYTDVIFTGSQCPVPVMTDVEFFVVGVFAGDLHTTTPAFVNARKSIMSGCGQTGTTPSVTPSAYDQIMSAFMEAVPYIAYYGITSHEDVLNAYNENRMIFMKNGATAKYLVALTSYHELNNSFEFSRLDSDNVIVTSFKLSNTGEWTASNTTIRKVSEHIQMQPVSVFGTANINARLETFSKAADAQYQWYYSTNNGATWINMGSNYKVRSISIQLTSSTNGRLYRCAVSSTSEGWRENTEAAGIYIKI